MKIFILLAVLFGVFDSVEAKKKEKITKVKVGISGMTKFILPKRLKNKFNNGSM
jgi:hypothetical protein